MLNDGSQNFRRQFNEYDQSFEKWSFVPSNVGDVDVWHVKTSTVSKFLEELRQRQA